MIKLLIFDSGFKAFVIMFRALFLKKYKCIFNVWRLEDQHPSETLQHREVSEGVEKNRN